MLRRGFVRLESQSYRLRASPRVGAVFVERVTSYPGGVVMFNATRPLILRTLVNPVKRELPRRCAANKMKELAAARAALLDTRETADRVIDSLVDRLLNELSW
jgi:hypothetical protein